MSADMNPNMNKHDFAKWLRDRIGKLHSPEPDLLICEDAAKDIDKARRVAQSLGYPDLVPECPSEFLAPHVARDLLSRALAVIDPPASGPLTVKQAAERLGVSPKTIYDLVEKGKIRCTRIGRAIRINPSDLGVGEKRYKHLRF